MTKQIESEEAGVWCADEVSQGVYELTAVDEKANDYLDDDIGRYRLRYGFLTIPIVGSSEDDCALLNHLGIHTVDLRVEEGIGESTIPQFRSIDDPEHGEIYWTSGQDFNTLEVHGRSFIYIQDYDSECGVMEGEDQLGWYEVDDDGSWEFFGNDDKMKEVIRAAQEV